MATRRITLACLAQSSRGALLSAPRFRPNYIPRLQNTRHFQTTSIRFEQQANTSAKRDPAPKIVRGASKVFKNADEAVADLKSGATILSAGFGLCGTAGRKTRFFS
jgi:3-oxoacid CoA-transferase